MRLRLFQPDDFIFLAVPVALPETAHIDSFQDIGLALRIFSVDNIDSRRKFNEKILIISEIIKL